MGALKNVVIDAQDKRYVHKGYANREEYLKGLAESYGVTLALVKQAATLHGEEEDFDGLVSFLDPLPMT